MSKIQISVSAALNPYLMADGMANLEKIASLGERAAKYMKSEDGKSFNLGAYYMPKKAKPIKHSAPKADKGDLKYLAQRATKIIIRKRATDNPAYTLLLPILTKESGAPVALMAQVKLAASALTQHARKSESVKVKVTKEKSKIREADNKAFMASVADFKQLLGAGGVKESDIVESRGMFGLSVLVKFGNNVVSIGKSDLARFRAAKKAAALTE